VRHLVTGGGFIGSHLADALIVGGNDVLVIDDFSTGWLDYLEHLAEAPGFELVRGSILDGDLVNECVDSVDCVFHLASAVGVRLIVRARSTHSRPTCVGTMR
jgi:UDP-glucose 4-epimerase